MKVNTSPSPLRALALLGFFALLPLVVSGVSVLSKRAAIDDCLKSGGVPVNAAGSNDLRLDTAPFNTRLPYTPIAIAVPTKVEHIQAAVACGAQLGIKVTPKCGGHSYASLGLGGENGHLVVELDRMNAVTVDSKTQIATIQGGARLGHVATALYAQGKRAISHGTCPGVGIAGHALHGGFGMVSHWKGLALDWMVGATVVLANTSVVNCSATQNSDLFWALRGAGSNFGIVSSFLFNTFAAPDTVTVFSVGTPWGNNVDQTVAGLTALNAYAQNTMPPEINFRLAVSGYSVVLEGVYVGNSQGLQTALQPLLSSASGLNIASARTGGWMDQLNNYAYGMALDQGHPYELHEKFYSKSLELKELSGQSLRNFVSYWIGTAKSLGFGRNWWFQMDMHGGKNSAISQVAVNGTSYAHRDKLFLIQFYDRIGDGDTYQSSYFNFLNGWIDTTTGPMKREDWGMYINYADSGLNRTFAQQAYWGANLGRLQQVKRRWDPKELFYYPISIQPV